jgi:uncharacterized membrane protein
MYTRHPHASVARPTRRTPTTAVHDDSDIWGLAIGCGVFLLEICAFVPGLLAGLLLTAALAVPLMLPLIPLALLAGVTYAIRGLLRLIVRTVRRLPQPDQARA